MYANLSTLAAFGFVYSAVAGRLQRTPINGALVFTAFGLAFGPTGIGLLGLSVDTEALRSLAELTLALVLFTDASNVNLGVCAEEQYSHPATPAVGRLGVDPPARLRRWRAGVQ